MFKSSTEKEAYQQFPQSIPALNLRKGVAIRGIGQKFAPNPISGASSLTVPIATSPGRSGSERQLWLWYDLGSASEPFGFRWSLSLCQIIWKTDKGLSQPRDVESSDLFIWY
jgi:hypothetical protein